MKRSLLSLLLLVFVYTGLAQDINIQGRVQHPTTNYLTFIKTGNDLFTNKKDTVFKVPIRSDGQFHISLKASGIETWMVEHGDNAALIDLQPGNNLKITFNKFSYHDGYSVEGDRLHDIHFMTALEKSALYTKPYNRDYVDKITRTADIKENLRLRIQRSKAKIMFLDQYQKKHPITGDYYTWRKNEFMYEPYVRLINENLSSKEFALTPMLFDEVEKHGLNNDTAALSSVSYVEFVDLYSIFKSNHGNFKKFRPSNSFAYGVRHFKGLTKEVFLTRQMVNMVYIDSIYNSHLETYLKEVKSPQMRSVVNIERNKVLKARNEVVNYKNISAYEHLSDIFTKYSGKLVYVDFWASWCGPCRREMPSSKELKKKLEGKEITFLYLGYDDQLTNWLVARKELGLTGEHILLNKEQMDEARQAFNISGIPHYGIINQRGEIIVQKASGPSQYQTQKELENLLKSTLHEGK
jgi:thiol-disulfide isomerase/thioredoxin